MKAQSVSTDTAQLCFNLGAGLGESGQCLTLAACPWEKELVPVVQEGEWAPGSGVENLAPPGLDFRTVQPIVSCFTDCAITAHSKHKYIKLLMKAIFEIVVNLHTVC